MPNGHGGYPFMGGPVLLLIAFLVVLFLPVDPGASHAGAIEILGLVVAAMFGCRLAYHLHMRKADGYGGAYTDPDKYRTARTRYWIACVVYGAIAVFLAHLAMEARG